MPSVAFFEAACTPICDIEDSPSAGGTYFSATRVVCVNLILELCAERAVAIPIAFLPERVD
jgi:hypothetical protein